MLSRGCWSRKANALCWRRRKRPSSWKALDWHVCKYDFNNNLNVNQLKTSNDDEWLYCTGKQDINVYLLWDRFFEGWYQKCHVNLIKQQYSCTVLCHDVRAGDKLPEDINKWLEKHNECIVTSMCGIIKNGLITMMWIMLQPPRSSDLNPTESLWVNWD